MLGTIMRHHQSCIVLSDVDLMCMSAPVLAT
jgi:hypothetical protein